MDIVQVKNILKEMFELEFKSNNSDYLLFGLSDYTFRLNNEEIKKLNNNCTNFKWIEKNELISDNYYEIPVTKVSSRVIEKRTISLEDEKNKIQYSIGFCSDEYLFKIINEYFQYSINHGVFLRVAIQQFFKIKVEKEYRNSNLLEFLKVHIFELKTLRIISDKKMSYGILKSLSNSFLFELSYNRNTVFITRNYLFDTNEFNILPRVKTSQIEKLKPPINLYVEELVYYYQNAIQSTSEDIQFLSFYHIFEYFYEKIFLDELVYKISSSQDHFNYSDKDKNELTEILKNELKRKNEQESLKIVLKYFFSDFNQLKELLSKYNDSLVEYFNKNKVSFSNGNTFNLDGSNKEILNSLSNRIYKTRNAIVHRKEADEFKFIPFKNNKELKKENILMKVIAEQIIIASSSKL